MIPNDLCKLYKWNVILSEKITGKFKNQTLNKEKLKKSLSLNIIKKIFSECLFTVVLSCYFTQFVLLGRRGGDVVLGTRFALSWMQRGL